MTPRLVRTALLAALPSGLLAPATTATVTAMTAAVVTALPGTALAEILPSPQDRSFVLLFLHASLAAQEAGELAADRGRAPGVRAYGALLLRHHDAGRHELAALAATLPLPPLPAQPDGNQLALLERLQRSPEGRFDHLFLTRLAAEQEDLIKVLSIQAATGDQPALRAFAQRQLPVLHDLVAQARALAAATDAAPLSASP